jgi:hypothetical protein
MDCLQPKETKDGLRQAKAKCQYLLGTVTTWSIWKRLAFPAFYFYLGWFIVFVLL